MNIDHYATDDDRPQEMFMPATPDRSIPWGMVVLVIAALLVAGLAVWGFA